MLGPTFDYTHRLLDPSILDGQVPEPLTREAEDTPAPRVTDMLGRQGLMEPDGDTDPDRAVGDLTREPLDFPLDRDLRLQALARGDGDRDFLEAKVATARYYAARQLPATAMHLVRIQSGAAPVMALEPASF